MHSAQPGHPATGRSLQLKTTYMPDDDSAQPAGHAVVQQQEEEMAVERKLAALQLGDTVDRFLPEPRMHDFRYKPETEMSDNSSCREEPLTKPDMEIKGEESMPSDDLPHDGVPERRCRKRETEIDAKAGATRHLSHYPDGMSARATNAADAKVGWTQHPSSGNNSTPMPNCRRIRISKQPEIKTPGRKSERFKEQNKQNCRWDKMEWRRAKRQSRRNAKLPAATPVKGDNITDNALQDMTRQEMLEAIEQTRQDYADLLQKKGDDPMTKTLLEAYEGLNQRFIKWENRFLYQIDACASSSEVSYVGEEIAYECGWQICKLRKKMVLPGTDGAVATGTVDVPIRIGKQTLGLQLFVSPHVAGYLVLGKVHDGRLILTFNNGDVVDTLSEDPVGLSFDATYLYRKDELAEGIFEFADNTPETEVHSMEETSEIVQSHTLESGAAPSITEDFAYIQEEEDLQKNEGVVPRMWSTVTNALSAQRDEGRRGVTGPYIPSFSENERSDRDREVEGATRTTGEVDFGSVETTDELEGRFPF